MKLNTNELTLIIDSLIAYLDDDNEEYNHGIQSLIDKLQQEL